MSLSLTFCFEIKKPTKQVMAGWRTMFGWHWWMEFSLVERECYFWETRSKLHVVMLRWRCQYFYWIPLSKRCKIDLKIILIGWAEHVFWIYSTCARSTWFIPHALEMCHTPPKMPIYWRDLEFILHTFFGGIFFSLGWQWSNVLGSAFRASWCSVLVEYSWWNVLGLCDTRG